LFCPPRFLHAYSAACHRQRAIRAQNPPRCAKSAATPCSPMEGLHAQSAAPRSPWKASPSATARSPCKARPPPRIAAPAGWFLPSGFPRQPNQLVRSPPHRHAHAPRTARPLTTPTRRALSARSPRLRSLINRTDPSPPPATHDRPPRLVSNRASQGSEASIAADPDAPHSGPSGDVGGSGGMIRRGLGGPASHGRRRTPGHRYRQRHRAPTPYRTCTTRWTCTSSTASPCWSTLTRRLTTTTWWPARGSSTTPSPPPSSSATPAPAAPRRRPT
jgi:hypothetical protein